MLPDNPVTLVIIAGLVWHGLLIVAVFLFDLGGESVLQSYEERILDEDTYEREFADD